jgi:hypothetical protein
MISPYTYVPEQRTMNTYVPLPYEDMLKAGLAKQQQYNVGEGAAADIDNFLKVQALDPDVDRRNQLVQGYKNELASQVQRAGGDYSKVLPFVKEQAKKIKEDLTYGPLGAIQSNYNTYQEAVKNLQKRVDEGDFLGQSDVGAWAAVEDPLKKYTGIGEGKSGIYNRFKPGTVGKFSDIAKEASDFAQQWAKNSGYSDLKRVNNEFYGYTTNGWVKAPEVNQAVQEYISNNPKYQEQLSTIEGFYDAQQPGAGKQFVSQMLQGIASPIAERESFREVTPHFMGDPTASTRLKRAYQKEDEASAYQTVDPEITAKQQENPFIGTPLEKSWSKDLKFVNGKAVLEGGLSQENLNKTFKTTDNRSASGALPIELNLNSKTGNQATIELQKEINNYRNKVASFKNLNDEQIMGALAQANKNSFAYNYQEVVPTNINMKNLSKQISSNMKAGNLKISIAGDYTPRKNETVYKELGISEEDLAKQIQSIDVASINPAKGGYSVTIQDKSGNPVKIDVTGFKEMGDHFALTKAISEAERNGKIGTQTINSDGKTYKLNTQLAPNPQTGEWAYLTDAVEERRYSKQDAKVLLDLAAQSGKTKSQLIAEGKLKEHSDGTITISERISDPRSKAVSLSEEWGGSDYMKPLRLKKDKAYWETDEEN